MVLKQGRGRPVHEDILTPAEWRVLHAAQHGLRNRDIAARLDVSVDAVKYHMKNILGKLDLPDRKALRAWFETPRHSALHGEREEKNMTDPVKLNSIGQIARTVSDIEHSTSWYRDSLGLSHLYSFGTLAFFDCDGVRLLLSETEQVKQDESIIYFKVDNIKAVCEGLQNHGIELTHAPHMIHRHEDGTEEWMAFFEDP